MGERFIEKNGVVTDAVTNISWAKLGDDSPYESPADKVADMLHDDYLLRDALRHTARQFGLNKNEVYMIYKG